MGRQSSIFKIQGELGGVSFYKTGKDGFLVREKGGIDGDRIKTDPNFARTRENNAEFGRAGSSTKLLRTALRSVILNSKDGRMTSRLTRAMMRVIHADETNARGERNAIDGEAGLLLGFEFNDDAKLGGTLFAAYTPTIDRATGICRVEFAAYSPLEMITAPSGATHYRLIMGAALVDFENNNFNSDFERSAEIPLSNQPAPATVLNANITAGATGPIFQVLGVEFLQHVNGTYYPMGNGANNALAIVQINTGEQF